MARDADTTPLRTVSPAPRRGGRESGSRSDRSGVRPSAVDTPAPDSEDTPIARDREESRDGADMLRAFLASAEGSEARAALEQSVKRVLQRGLEGAGHTTPPLPPDLADTVRRWGAILAFALAVAAPIVQQVAGLLADFARPNQVVTDQLAEIRAAQVEADERDAKQEQLLRDSIAWMIDANRALASDAPMPKVPASLNLAKAQAEAAQDQ